jgi:DNA repair protein RecN (Recombination protein N)
VTLLDEGDGCLGDASGEAAQLAARAAERDPGWRDLAQGLDSLAIAARELGRDARALGERAVADPARLEELRERVRVLRDLLRKYGPDEDALLATWERLREEGADPEAMRRTLAERERRAAERAAALLEAGRKLRAGRQKAAKRLRRALEPALEELGMEGSRFEVRITPRTQGSTLDAGSGERAAPSGLDDVEFLLSANRGEELRPLAAVASGGEISRVMLAMKSVLVECRGTATMVFDEIDAGVGGAVALRVADRLEGLARTRQVVCITHLAQVASRAAVHLQVRKEERDGRTVSTVDPVDGEARVQEIARMLGGRTAGVALEHARELLGVGGPGRS